MNALQKLFLFARNGFFSWSILVVLAATILGMFLTNAEIKTLGEWAIISMIISAIFGGLHRLTIILSRKRVA